MQMEADGLTKPVMRERTFQFNFPECEKLPPPVMPFTDVAFSYSGKKVLAAERRTQSAAVGCPFVLPKRDMD